jgi:hypothetical protein
VTDPANEYKTQKGSSNHLSSHFVVCMREHHDRALVLATTLKVGDEGSVYCRGRHDFFTAKYQYTFSNTALCDAARGSTSRLSHEQHSRIFRERQLEQFEYRVICKGV